MKSGAAVPAQYDIQPLASALSAVKPLKNRKPNGTITACLVSHD